LSFRGTYEHALDAKHRLTVPAKFRPELAGGAVLAASPETEPGGARCVSIWTAEAYEQFTANTLRGLNPASPKARELKRFFFNTSFDAAMDSANRLMIPAPLMRYAGLEKDVIVTGSGECMEVWDREAYERYHEQVLSRVPEIAASLGDTA
jgi:MraZ protein